MYLLNQSHSDVDTTLLCLSLSEYSNFEDDYSYLETEGHLSNEEDGTQGSGNVSPNPDATPDEENHKVLSLRHPDVLYETNLTLLTYEQCAAGFNHSVPTYLLCHNASHGTACYVSIILRSAHVFSVHILASDYRVLYSYLPEELRQVRYESILNCQENFYFSVRNFLWPWKDI